MLHFPPFRKKLIRPAGFTVPYTPTLKGNFKVSYQMRDLHSSIKLAVFNTITRVRLSAFCNLNDRWKISAKNNETWIL
jgi:hypothetical protein